MHFWHLDKSSLTTCLLHYTQLPDIIVFPLKYSLIADQQQQDEGLLETMEEKPQKFHYIQLGKHNIICYIKQENELWKICIPESLVYSIMKWYHEQLNHIGMTRLTCTIATHFYHFHLKTVLNNLYSIVMFVSNTNLIMSIMVNYYHMKLNFHMTSWTKESPMCRTGDHFQCFHMHQHCDCDQLDWTHLHQ